MSVDRHFFATVTEQDDGSLDYALSEVTPDFALVAVRSLGVNVDAWGLGDALARAVGGLGLPERREARS